MRRTGPASLLPLPFLLAVAFALLWMAGTTARAGKPALHPSAAPVKEELTAVIDAQLAAFRANDYPKAYTFAAEEIRGMFAPEAFETMVKTGYPVIAHSSTADYGFIFDTGEEAVVNVRLETADRRSGQYQYLLKKQDGTWKITGVSELKSEGLSV